VHNTNKSILIIIGLHPINGDFSQVISVHFA